MIEESAGRRGHIVILRGLPGSGKTTYAKEWIGTNPLKHTRISKDELRAMLVNGYDPLTELFVQAARDALIASCIDHERPVIIDDTNLNPKHIESIKRHFEWRATIEIVDFTDVALQTCI